MNRTFANGGKPRRGGIALALLATTAALAGGVQALAPAPAAAAIAQGEDCADPTVVSIECETTGGGGAGSDGSGSAGGAGAGTVGSEVIVVEGKAPLCTTCMPSEIGGRHQPGVDGVGQRPHGRHGGRPSRVAQAPKRNDKEDDDRPSLEECQALWVGAVALSVDSKIQGLATAIESLDNQARGLMVQRGVLEVEASSLTEDTPQLDALRQTIRAANRRIYELRDRSFKLGTTRLGLQRERVREERNLRWECSALYGGKVVEVR
jgi:hypothetical protein